MNLRVTLPAMLILYAAMTSHLALADSEYVPICRELFQPWIMQGQSFDDALESDRPDFTESSSVVGLHRLQIESGYNYLQDDSGPILYKEHLLPELLVRYGLSDSLELRIGWPGHLISSQLDQSRDGLLPIEAVGGVGMDVGFKSQFTDQDGFMPQFGLIYSLNLPVGDPEIGPDRVGASVVGAYSWELTERVSIGGGTGGYCLSLAGDYFNSVSQSFAIYFGISKRLNIFNEWYMQAYSGAEDSRPEQYYDGGVTFLLTPNFQLDWRAGVGLTEASADFFTGTGFSVRW